MIASPRSLNYSLSEFSHKIEHEFVGGSAIAADLFQAAVHLVPDIVTLPGGEVLTPIHDALLWRYTRFGNTARASLFAALLQNESGSTWQAKLSRPRTDAEKGKSIKYETPVGAGACAYLPPVPTGIRRLISKRYKVEVPLSGSFWEWLEEQEDVPIIWTEGAKKALSLLSHGYVAIALYGINGGYKKLVDGSRVLISDVERFAQNREHILCFDQDTNLRTRRRVNVALHRFGSLLQKDENFVSLIQWESQHGKGVDDFIVNRSVYAFTKAYTDRISLIHWKLREKLENKLTYPCQLQLRSNDLTTLDFSQIPETGIVAISSAKGTGKTKFIAKATADYDKVLSATHRIALGRNLCSRLGLNWRGDLDRVKGEFITGAGYTLKVGFCVDSLLAINPEKFEGCDLVIDEVGQVIRHLLTSSTCAKEGKRPALLARFREIIQAARRVIAADADLDNATLAYLQELRAYLPENPETEVKDSNIFLIRNDYKSEGYHAHFIDCADRSGVTAKILEDLPELPPWMALFVVTDSKATSKAIAAAIAQCSPRTNTLLINSETSGGKEQREFVNAPDLVLSRNQYQVIICSPSLATGVSIEAQGLIDKIYGIFVGVSATDADMAQALSRVREPVDRVIWCAKTGKNYSRISRSQNYLEFKSHLQQSTAATVRLVRSGLREDTVSSLTSLDWATNPHINLYSQLSVDANYSMANLRDALKVRLKHEGNQVSEEAMKPNEDASLLLRAVREEQVLQDAEKLVAAPDLTLAEVLALELKESVSPEEQLGISKFYFKEFYALETLTVEDILYDNEGRRRAEILGMEAQVHPELARSRTVRSIENQLAWQKGICPWDVSTQELKRVLRDRLKLIEFIEDAVKGSEWCKYDLSEYAATARALAEQIKVALNFTIHDNVCDTQILHQLLNQLGIQFDFRWSREVPGHEGEKIRIYRMNSEAWDALTTVLERRAAKREKYKEEVLDLGSPPDNIENLPEGDPEEIASFTELIADAAEFGAEAVLAIWVDIDKDMQKLLLHILPEPIKRTIEAL